MTERPQTGGCLCGGVRFELTEPPTDAGYCHCRRCQRRTGTAASAQARIDGRSFRLLAGESLVKAWRRRALGVDRRRRARAPRRRQAAQLNDPARG